MNVQKIYEYALQREEEGFRFFSDHAANTRHAVIKEIFERLADEEANHISFIKRHLAATDDSQPAGESDLAGSGWFDQRAAAEQLEQSLSESMLPDVAVLRTAFLIERDLAEFYEMAANRAEGQNRKVFQQLAAWERGHETLFKELHDRIFKHYTEMPWGG